MWRSCRWAPRCWPARAIVKRILRDTGVELTRISGLPLSASAVQLMAEAVRAFVTQG